MGIGYPYQTRFKESCDYTYKCSVREYWIWYHIVANRAFRTIGVILSVVFLHLARFDFSSDPQVFSLCQIAATLYLTMIVPIAVMATALGTYGLWRFYLFMIEFYTGKYLYY